MWSASEASCHKSTHEGGLDSPLDLYNDGQRVRLVELYEDYGLQHYSETPNQP